MNFGVFLNQYYTPDGAFEVTDLYEQVSLIEDVGFDLVSVGERHVHEAGIAEPLTTLAAIASRTDQVNLATMALLPAIHHPIHLAEQVSMIDRLSDGRMIFGGAIGYREVELAPFDVSLDERVPKFLESLSVLKRLWAGDRVTHKGDHLTIEDVFISPTPVEQMPVWIGGHADIAIKRAAYRGEAWIASASATREDLQRQIQVYEDALDEFDMNREDNQVVLMRDCSVADSAAMAREKIEPYLLNLYRMYARWGQTYLDENEVAIDYDELAEKFVIGSPEDCIAQLREYEKLGVDHVVIRCQFPGQPQQPTLSSLEQFGEVVLPEFQ